MMLPVLAGELKKALEEIPDGHRVIINDSTQMCVIIVDIDTKPSDRSMSAIGVALASENGAWGNLSDG